MKLNNFVIYTYGRTGSSYLCDLLNSHSKIDCYYEVYKDHLNQADGLNEIEKLFKSHGLINGFKVLHYQGNSATNENLFKNTQYKKILLTRENPIDRFISFELAKKTGLWHIDNQVNNEVLSKGLLDILKFKYSLKDIFKRLQDAIHSYLNKNKNTPEKVTINFDDLVQDVKNVNEFNNKIKSQVDAGELLIISYEELCSNKEMTIKKLLSFLNLEFEELISSREKINHLKREERIENYRELREKLKDTDLAKYL